MEDLMHAAKNGNKTAFEQLMRLFQDRAFAVALSQLGNYHQAEDAVQEAFVEAYLRLEQLQSPQAFPAWLHKIVLGKCVRVIRGGKSVVAPVSLELLAHTASDATDPEALLLEKSVRETLQKAVGLLSDQEREAFLLFAVGGYRYAEIGQMMEIPLSLVKKRIYTARQQLRSGEELASLRPSRQPGFEKRVAARMQARVRKEETMSKSEANKAEPFTVTLLGPGVECKTVVKNLYVFYRYEMLMWNQYEAGITPPAEAAEETWVSGAWPNAFGVINGLHSTTHAAAVAGEDVFWEWPNLQAYLIEVNGWPAGFACVASPPNATKGVDYRLQELFVINKARRKGVARSAMRQLFDRLPGRWELEYNPDNLPATAFWRNFLPAYTNGDFTDEKIGMGAGPDWSGYVFTKGQRPPHPIAVRGSQVSGKTEPIRIE